MPPFNLDREEGILSVIIFAITAVVTQNVGISIAVTIAAIYAVTLWFPNGAAGLLAQPRINSTMAENDMTPQEEKLTTVAKSDMTPQELHEKYTALSLKECEYFVSLKTPEEKVSELNDKARKEIEAKVAGLIPTPKRAAPKLLNIVLLGKTGAGKSDAGNLILGKKDAFEASASTSSVTPTVKIEESTIDGMRIRVCDTPGSIDTKRSEQAIAAEILKIGMHFKEGIHLFIFIKNMANPRFTEEEIKAFEVIKKAFSKKALDHCIFMMSHADFMLGIEELKERTIEGYLEHVQKEDEKKDGKGNESVQAIYESVGNRVIAVENRPNTVYEREAQRRFLIEYFKSTIEMAENETFQHEAFKKANEKLKGLLGDKYGEDVKDAVWAYLQDLTYEEMEKLRHSKTATRRALKEIMARNPDLKGKDNDVQSVVQFIVEVMVDNSILAMLSGFALALFVAAGAIIAGPIFAVAAVVTGGICIVWNWLTGR